MAARASPACSRTSGPRYPATSPSRTTDLAFLESDYSNNTAWASFRLRRDSQGNPKLDRIAHSPCAGTLCGATPNR